MASEENIAPEKSQPVRTSETASAVKHLESRLNNCIQDATTLTVEKYLQYIKPRSFKETYPEIYKENKKHLKEIHNQFIIQLKDTFLDESKEICFTSNLHNSLYLLDNLNTKYEDRIKKESWRPSGIPSKDLRDHLHQVKLKHKKCLEFQLQTLVNENKSIAKTLETKHQEIMNKESNIERLNQDLKKCLQGIHPGSIARFEKEMTSNVEHM